jgi:signal transduction histidine kinase
MPAIAHGKGVDVAFVNGTAHDMVRGDPARLRQLFLVLLDNAVRYSKSKGAVKVEIGSADGEVRVRVSDRGIGIRRRNSMESSSASAGAAMQLSIMKKV